MTRGRTATKQAPPWAVALKVRRVQLGLSQEGIADLTEGTVSQSTMSSLEVGRQQLTDLAYMRVVALARALNWSLAEMQQATGVDLGITPAERLTTAEPTPVYSLKALASSNPTPDGFNVTPHPGPHPQHWKQTFMEGDEMDPRIPAGFSIYFDTGKTTPDKGIYVIRQGDRVLVRRYSELPSGPAWTTDNPAHALSFIPASQDVQVLGKVYRIVGIREAPSLLN